MNSLLPIIKDPEHYSQLFSQDKIWEPAVRYLANQHSLHGDLKRGRQGSHIVYRVGNHWIKLMAPIYKQDMIYEIAGLECVKGQLSVQTPELVAEGFLEDWHYIVLTHVEGKRVGDIWKELYISEKNKFARQIANVTLELQACQPNPVVRDRAKWKDFIADRFENLVPHHKSKGLDDSQLEKLPEFLTQFKAEEFLPHKEVFLHSDLTYDHFLVHQSEISAVIDFADCRVGHPEYDIPASAVFIFKGEYGPLKEYLLALGYKDSELNQRFSEKLMAWTCLHYFSDLNKYFGVEMKALAKADFSVLASKVFPL